MKINSSFLGSPEYSSFYPMVNLRETSIPIKVALASWDAALLSSRGFLCSPNVDQSCERVDLLSITHVGLRFWIQRFPKGAKPIVEWESSSAYSIQEEWLVLNHIHVQDDAHHSCTQRSGGGGLIRSVKAQYSTNAWIEHSQWNWSDWK